MGIRERHDRERQAVRDAILDAARDLFVTEGYRNVSIRKIAERIEYSPAAIYSYFPGKDDIFFALAEEGFRRLDAKCQQMARMDGAADAADVTDDADAAADAAADATDDADGAADDTDDADSPDGVEGLNVTAAQEAQGGPPLAPLDELRQCWWAFYEFSREQPEFFELMFVDRSVPSITEQWQAFAVLREIMEGVEATIQRVIDAGALPATLDACVVLHVLFGALMGPAVLGLTNRMGPGEDADALARDVLETTIAGLTTGVSLTFLPCEQMHASSDVEPSPGAGSQ